MTPESVPQFWDAGDHIVKLVRRADGSAYLVAIPCPNPWVYRVKVLAETDVD